MRGVRITGSMRGFRYADPGCQLTGGTLKTKP
jgi:hypothetical protein